MLTKKKAADLIIDRKSGGDSSQTSKYDKRIVYYWLDVARAQMIGQEHRISKRVRDVYLRSYNVNVEEDSARNQKYFQYPSNIISISNDTGGELGIFRVSATQSNTEAFSIMRTGMNDILKSLDGEDPNQTSVTLEGNRGYFDKLGLKIETVRVTVIPSLEGIAEDDQIPIPADMEMELINIASQLMDEQKQTVQDKTNDTNSQQIWATQRKIRQDM